MVEEQTEDYGAIRTLSLDCENLFDELTKHKGLSPVSDLLEDYQQRFLTWAAYLGVFAHPSQCLDRRLRSAPDVKDVVLRALDCLGRCLTLRLFHDQPKVV